MNSNRGEKRKEEVSNLLPVIRQTKTARRFGSGRRTPPALVVSIGSYHTLVEVFFLLGLSKLDEAVRGSELRRRKIEEKKKAIGEETESERTTSLHPASPTKVAS